MMSSVQPPTAPPKKKAYWIQAQVLSGMRVTVRDADEGLAPRFNFNFNGLNQGVNFFSVAPLNLAQSVGEACTENFSMAALGINVGHGLFQAHSSIVLSLLVRRVVTLGTSGGGGGGAGRRSSV
jgi:hypothetical protein